MSSFALRTVGTDASDLIAAINRLCQELQNFSVSGGRALVVESGASVIINSGGTIQSDGASYAGTHSYQPVGPDLNLAAAAGGAVGSPKFLASVMGNVLGANLTKQGAYLAGTIGAFSVTGTKASHWPTGGIIGIVMDGVTDVDGAVVAHLDGDSAQTIANAAFKAMMKNTTPGSGFNFGSDYYLAAADGFPVLAIIKAVERSPHQVCRLEGDGAPTTAGTGFAAKGSLYTDYTNANLYLNAGDATTPSWKLVTRAA